MADLGWPASYDNDGNPVDGWEQPVPLGTTGELPPFPVEALPDWAAAMVRAVAEDTQTPPDLPGVVCLGVLATAAGGCAEVEVQPGWIEPVNLYAAPALDPGSRKSAVFREMTRPILDAEQQIRGDAAASIREAAIAQDVAQEAVKRAVLEAARLKTDQARAAALAAAELAASVTVPAWPRLIADDATPEALTSLLAQHGGRIAVLSAEGDLFDIMSGRYSGNHQIPNLGVFLKGHCGDLLLVDRKGREPERIERPALTIVVCIQPRVLLDIARKPVLRGRGLLARVLYSLPPDLVGRREIDTPPVPAEVRDRYRTQVQALTLSLAAWTDPAMLPLTREARKILAEYQREIEPRLIRDTGDLSALRDWASKLAGAAVRIAALLHLGEHLPGGWGQPIGAGTMERAVTLGRYFTEHARAAFWQMNADPVADDAKAILGWIERRQPQEFTRRELHMAMSRGRFPKATDLDPPLALLQAHGYIRALEQPERAGPGRPPSVRYAVHPDLSHDIHAIHGTPDYVDSVDSVAKNAPMEPGLCRVCGEPLDPALIRAGYDTHPDCEYPF